MQFQEGTRECSKDSLVWRGPLKELDCATGCPQKSAAGTDRFSLSKLCNRILEFKHLILMRQLFAMMTNDRTLL